MPWKPPVDNAELERLKKLISYYEASNMEQLAQLEMAKAHGEENIKRLGEMEVNRKKLVKTINSLEAQMKFDKIASDGIKKKFNLLELEHSEVSYDRDRLTTERAQDKKYIKELEDDLNKNRVDKLRFMHENAILRRENAALSNSENAASTDAVSAREDLLARLQDLDNIMSLNANQKATIDIQSEEMIALAQEVQGLKQKQQSLNQQLLEHDVMCAEYNKTIDGLQSEVSRLRKELVMASENANSMSDWYTSQAANRVSTAIATNAYTNKDSAFAAHRRPFSQTGEARQRNREDSVAAGISDTDREFNRTQRTGIASFSPSCSAGLPAVTASPSPSPHNKLRSSEHISSPARTPLSSSGATVRYRYDDCMSKAEQMKAEEALRKPIGAADQDMRSHMIQECDDMLIGFADEFHSPVQQSRVGTAFTRTGTAAAGKHARGLDATGSSNRVSTAVSRSPSRPHRASTAAAVLSPDATPYRSGTMQAKRLAEISASSRRGVQPELNNTSSSSSSSRGSFIKDSVSNIQKAYGGQQQQLPGKAGLNSSGGKPKVRRTVSTGNISRGSAQLRSVGGSSTGNTGVNDAFQGSSSLARSEELVLTADGTTAANVIYVQDAIQQQQQQLPTDEFLLNDSDTGTAATVSSDGSTFVPVVGNRLELPSLVESTLTVDNRATAGHSQQRPCPQQSSNSEVYHDPSSSNKKKKGARKKAAPSAPQKSKFIGAGLGLRHNDKLDAELRNLNRGTAKQVIRNVLGDRYDED